MMEEQILITLGQIKTALVNIAVIQILIVFMLVISLIFLISKD